VRRTFKRKRRALGIMLEEHWAQLVLMEQTGGGVREIANRTFRMSLDVLKDAPELVAQELRDHLGQAHGAGRACVVCVPTRWLLTAAVEFPDMPDIDEASFLELQAERLLPLAVTEVRLKHSRFQVPGGPRGATLLALPVSRLDKVLAVFDAAHLHPVCVTSATAALVQGHSLEGKGILHVTAQSIDLCLAGGGGIVALRPIASVQDGTAGQPELDSKAMAREIRITLKRLPRALAERIEAIAVYGDGDAGDALVQVLQDEFTGAIPRIERGRTGDARDTGSGDVEKKAPAPAVAAAVRQYLAGIKPGPDFLPERVSRFRRVARKVLERRVASFISATAAVVLILGSVFLYQGRTRSRLEAQWESVEPQAEALRALQEKVRAYRDWFDDSPSSLVIARQLTECFPEDGGVWLKSLTIKDLSSVTCTGSASSARAWLAVLDALRSAPHVRHVQVSQVRGDAPLEFSFSFEWRKGAQ
jgi:Tfp pilus assembly protein PilN